MEGAKEEGGGKRGNPGRENWGRDVRGNESVQGMRGEGNTVREEESGRTCMVFPSPISSAIRAQPALSSTKRTPAAWKGFKESQSRRGIALSRRFTSCGSSLWKTPRNAASVAGGIRFPGGMRTAGDNRLLPPLIREGGTQREWNCVRCGSLSSGV